MSTQDGFRADWANKDFYKVLGVAKDATPEQLKKSYRKLARENHPDSNPGDSAEAKAKQETFKSVAEAYDVVGDPEKRKKYDEMRSLTGSGQGGFGGGNFPGGFGGGGSGGFDLNDLLRQTGGAGGGIGDVFGDMFGGRRTSQGRRPQKGGDTETTATISFTDALDGVTISLRLASDAACTTCQGMGGKPGTRPHICPECEGAGFIVSDVGGGSFSLNETCPTCAGRQLIYDEPCPTCHGSGRGTSSRTIQARIPAGVKDGQRIRVRGKGSPGQNGGQAGDLYIAVKVTPHRLFGRKADNLTLDVPVSFDEAALGAEIKIPTLSGNPVTLKIPAGTPNDRTFRVRGKGARKSDGSYGDLLATVHVQVPAQLDATAREAVESYRAAMAGKPLRANLFDGVS